MTPIKLSDNFTIYTDRYEGEYSIEEFLKYVELNDKMSIHTNNNSVWMEIETECFQSFNSYIKNKIEEITNRTFKNYAQHHWVYTQRKGFDMEWMHQHIQVHPPGRSLIKSDYTFTFYLQTTDEISGDEGKIVFQTEDGIKHKFLPSVGDIFIFPADIRHTAIPNPNSNKERIVYAGSYCLDIFNQMNYEKSTI